MDFDIQCTMNVTFLLCNSESRDKQIVQLFRAVRVLQAAEVILAEDTRHSARLLHHYNITTPMVSTLFS